MLLKHIKYILLVILFAGNLFATNYYVKNNGNDNADGLSDSTAWKTIAKVNKSKFLPGDNIYFKRGDVWREQLNVRSSGAPGQPITFGAYGTGLKPVINGADLYNNNNWPNVGTNLWKMNNPQINDSTFSLIDDGLDLIRVYSKSALTKGKYYLDISQSPDVIYLYSTDDPDSHIMEITNVRSYGIYLGGNNTYIVVKNLTVCNAKYAGLRFDGHGYYNSNPTVRINGNSIIDSVTAYNNMVFGIDVGNGYGGVVIQNCTAHNNGNGLYADANSDGTIFKNNISYSNYYPYFKSDRDGIGIYKSSNNIVEGNLVYNNAYGTGIEVDGDYTDSVIIIRYNKLYSNGSQYEGYAIGLGHLKGDASKNLIYYNICYNDGNDPGSQRGAEYAQLYMNASVYNNTFYTTGSIDALAVQANGTGLLIFKNNIVYTYGGTAGRCLYGNDTAKINSDYNLFYSSASTPFRVGHSFYTFAKWQELGYDTHSINADPKFVDIKNNFNLQATSPAINAGLNVNLNKDYKDYPVPKYKPDIGAIQHSFILVNIKVYLEGAYNNGIMSTNLNSKNLIPKKQPYNISPWNYAGAEAVTSIPSSIVDWVLVELRTGIDSSTITAKRAGFIKSDGSIVDLDGISPLRFDFVPAGNYYIVVMHRNHLAVMSSKPAALSDTTALYDFSTSESQASGINSMADLGNGIYGMYTGDGDANGGVSSTDRNNVWLKENGKAGYLQGDFDLNGVVNNDDLNLHWIKNNGKLSQVPN